MVAAATAHVAVTSISLLCLSALVATVAGSSSVAVTHLVSVLASGGLIPAGGSGSHRSACQHA
jgi:hypothetical protein